MGKQVETTEAMDVKQAAARLEEMRKAVGGVIRGKDEIIELALVGLLARGHLLIEDVPGVGKTMLARALARCFNCSFQRVQFTSDLLPSDVVGISVFDQQSQGFIFKPGPIFANVILADEINRTTPKTQSALLEAMNEEQVTVDGNTHALPQPFLVLATQNPVEHHGTYPLPESQLDRFLLRLRIGYPDAESEKEILRAQAGSQPPIDGLEPLLNGGDILQLQKLVTAVRVDDSLIDYALAVANLTRENEYLSLGVSPRGSIMLYRAAQARALLHARDYCIPDDIQHLIVPVFAHRVVVNARFVSTQRKSFQAESVLEEILAAVEVPL